MRGHSGLHPRPLRDPFPRLSVAGQSAGSSRARCEFLARRDAGGPAIRPPPRSFPDMTMLMGIRGHANGQSGDVPDAPRSTVSSADRRPPALRSLPPVQAARCQPGKRRLVPTPGETMNRLHVLAAAGLVALTGCADQPTPRRSSQPPDRNLIAVTPSHRRRGADAGPGDDQNTTYSSPPRPPQRTRAAPATSARRQRPRHGLAPTRRAEHNCTRPSLFTPRIADVTPPSS